MIERVLEIKFNFNFKIIIKFLFTTLVINNRFAPIQYYSPFKISLFNKKIEVFSNIYQKDLVRNDSFTIIEITIQNYKNKKKIILNENYAILKERDTLFRYEQISDYLENNLNAPLNISNYFMTKNMDLFKDLIQLNNLDYEITKFITINIKEICIDVALKILEISYLPFCFKKKYLEKWFGEKFSRFLNLRNINDKS